MERVAFGEISIEDDLKSSGYQLVYESYVERNWELFVINADGTGTRNLTQTPDVHELYPQVSPDGGKKNSPQCLCHECRWFKEKAHC